MICFPIGKSHARACAAGRSYISNRKRVPFTNANANATNAYKGKGRKGIGMTLLRRLCVLQG
jgi:hypothetical protein